MPPTAVTARRRISRAGFLKTAAAGGVATAGVLLEGGAEPARSAGSRKQDAEILGFVLRLERLQAAFYEEALDKAGLRGEVRRFARVVAGHERAHVQFLERALGADVPARQRYAFGRDTRDPKAFLVAGRRIEDVGVRAYNGQAPNLTEKALASAARIVSVEARHAAWIRDLAGVDPAPDAAEPVLSADEAQARLRDLGYMR